MLCFACGCEMRVAQVAPDETFPVGGYVQRTLECPQCGDVEHRLLFAGDQAAAEAIEPAAEAVEPAAEVPAPVASEPSIADATPSEAPPARWAQAVERLRMRNAVLALEAAAQKATQAPTSDEHARGQEFNQLWDNLGKSYPPTTVPAPKSAAVAARSVAPSRPAASKAAAPPRWELPKRVQVTLPTSAKHAAAATASAVQAAGQSARDAMNRAFARLRSAYEHRINSDASGEPRSERHDAILQIDTDALKVMPPKRTLPRPL
jgi:hypothetical protein